MTAYVVTAFRLEQRISKDGEKPRRVNRYRRGDTVSDLSAADVERHLKSGAIVAKSSAEAKAAVADPAPEPITDVYAPEDVVSAPERPKQTANKAEWQEYAVACGWSEDEAAAASKAELVKGTK